MTKKHLDEYNLKETLIQTGIKLMLKIDTIRTVADLIEDLGVSASRILMHPAPGTATEQDVVDLEASKDCLAELYDGVLVEKAMGFEESIVGATIIFLLKQYVTPRKLGIIAGSDAMVRYRSGNVQMADVAFFSWGRFSEGKVGQDAISLVTPDLAIEIISKSNTVAEMERKRREYFDSGTSLVWQVNHRTRTVEVFTDVESSVEFCEHDIIDGGTVFPDFRALVSEFFADLPAE